MTLQYADLLHRKYCDLTLSEGKKYSLKHYLKVKSTASKIFDTDNLFVAINHCIAELSIVGLA